VVNKTNIPPQEISEVLIASLQQWQTNLSFLDANLFTPGGVTLKT